METFIENDKIKIVYTRKEDISYVMEMEQAKENRKFVGQWTFEQHMNAITSNDMKHLLIQKKDSTIIGFIMLKGLIL